MSLQWTGWSLSNFDESPTVTNGKETLRILRRHEFSSALARMSVVVELGSGKLVLAKGAPREIISRCASGVPDDIQAFIDAYAAQGMRLIGLASRPLGDTAISDREGCEQDLNFEGLLVLRNSIKEEAFSVVATLQDTARIRVSRFSFLPRPV